MDRSKIPSAGPRRPLRLPIIHRMTLTNGLKLVIAEQHDVPYVVMEVVSQSGSVADPNGKAGLVDLTATLLSEGTAKRTATEIADELDFLGATMTNRAGWDSAYIIVSALSKYVGKVIEILSDVSTNAVFLEKEIERVKGERLAQILQNSDNPSLIANDMFEHFVYYDHPYAQPRIGSEVTVKSINKDDLVGLYEAHFKPNNSVLLIVGDVITEQIVRLVEEYFGEWEKGDVPEIRPAKVKPIDSKQIFLVDKPDAVQSELRIGHVGIKRDNPDYFPIHLMNGILGGKFTSRVNLNLREKHGYTYGARTSFICRKDAGPFIASAAVHNEVTGSAVVEFLYELNRIRAEPVPDGELEDAKGYYAGRFPYLIEASHDLAGALLEIEIYNLAKDYLETYCQNIQDVAKLEVETVARQYIDTDHMAIVVVGDSKMVANDLKRIAPVTVYDIHGQKLQSIE